MISHAAAGRTSDVLRMPLLLMVLVLAGSARAEARPLPALKVSDNHRHLVRAEDGQPFFYLADTAWELFHRLDRKQALTYLDKRAAQRFTVIQAVALAELGIDKEPNAQGDIPLIDRDPTKPAVTPGANPANAAEYDYWDHVDFVVDAANARGLYVALLPSWARWVNDEKDRIFDETNAATYGAFLGKRYGRKGVIWVLGGDRIADGREGVWRAMARGIVLGIAGKEDWDRVLMTMHPPGGMSSSHWFHEDPWLDFNMHQTGHSRAEKTRSWRKIARDYERVPTKPVLDGEPIYEDIPLEFNGKDMGLANEAHVRQRAYWAVFAGACGHTYGNNLVWQMHMPKNKGLHAPAMYWDDALDRPGAQQMAHLRALVESRPMASRVPDQDMLVDALEGSDHVSAIRGDGHAFVYSAMGRRFEVKLGRISGDKLAAWWWNPRTGRATFIDHIEDRGTREFVCPAEGFGNDWVLVLDDPKKGFRSPGAAPGRDGGATRPR